MICEKLQKLFSLAIETNLIVVCYRFDLGQYDYHVLCINRIRVINNHFSDFNKRAQLNSFSKFYNFSILTQVKFTYSASLVCSYGYLDDGLHPLKTRWNLLAVIMTLNQLQPASFIEFYRNFSRFTSAIFLRISLQPPPSHNDCKQIQPDIRMRH